MLFVTKARRKYELYNCESMPELENCNTIWHALRGDLKRCQGKVHRIRDYCERRKREKEGKMILEWDEILFEVFVARPVGRLMQAFTQVFIPDLDAWSRIDWFNDNIDKIPRSKYWLEVEESDMSVGS